MPLQANSFSQINDLYSRLSDESIFAQSGSDDGLVPAYSLLSEMIGLAGDAPELVGPMQELLHRLDGLLSESKPFDAAAVEHLRNFANWLPLALMTARLEPLKAVGGLPPIAPVSDPVAVALPAVKTVTADEAPAEELLVLNMEEYRDLLGEFQAEALDHLQQIEAALLVLDANPGDRGALNGLFRSFHTIKGVSGFLSLRPMHRLTHEVESLLDLARTDRLRLSPAIITEILRSRDVLDEMVCQITNALESGNLPDRIIPVNELIKSVRELVQATVEALAEEEAGAVAAALHSQETTSPFGEGGGDRTSKGVSSSSIRVKIEKLDLLVDLVGELVIVQSQLGASGGAFAVEAEASTRNLARLSLITKELQLMATALRMVPIKPTFQRVERLVRDLSRAIGKSVVFETCGEEIEMDRTVVEAIVDPLVHMVRNSLGHGIETAERRLAAGKPAQGRLRLAAFREGSRLVIELSDDGQGIDTARVLAKAQAMGLVPAGANPAPDEVLNLIFLPGFSTAERVTSVSGRGVGMDVVKRNIDRLHGQIQINTQQGIGTTFRILLPHCSAVSDGLASESDPVGLSSSL
jgi:two-component system chemotaxis sensor kinase CheA